MTILEKQILGTIRIKDLDVVAEIVYKYNQNG